MRTSSDRIRQALLFEALGLVIATPLASTIMDQPMHVTGGFVVISSIVATSWNYLFNLGFDHALRRATGSTGKRLWHRVLHATLFETVLIGALWPVARVWMGVSWTAAFGLVTGLAVFYVLYAFVFTWAYDTVFPDPEASGSGQGSGPAR